MRTALVGVVLATLLPVTADAGGTAIPSDDRQTPKPTFATCEAARAHYQSLSGHMLVQPVPFTPHRIITPHTFVTLEFNPDRLNIYVDDADVILKASCG